MCIREFFMEETKQCGGHSLHGHSSDTSITHSRDDAVFWDDDHRQCGGILCLHNISLSLDSDYKSFASKTHI